MSKEISWIDYQDRSLNITRKTKPKFEEWASLMATFNQMAESSPFWRGDLYLKGEEWYGVDVATSIFEPDKWRLKTWQNNASICSFIEATRRREELSYSHHAEVAYLKPTQFKDPPRATTGELQSYYLQIAIDNHLSVRKLRDKIKFDRDGKDPPKSALYKRLETEANRLVEWMDEAEGDVKELMTTAIESLQDAAEIEKDNE